MEKKTIRDIDAAGKRVLVRVDFNVPLRDGVITDDTRITAALPTIRYLQEQGARVILVTHLGRPKGKVVPEMSVKFLVEHLGKLLGQDVMFAADCGGEESVQTVSIMTDGQVAILENVRFYPGEEKNDPGFAQALARLGDIYVNDAFGTAHRAHASTEGVARYLPAVAGFLMERELEALSMALYNPQRPFAAIFGGAKVSDKISVIRSLSERVDYILIGGGMANTFLKAAGNEMGKSLVEEDKVEEAGEILQKLTKKGMRIILPVDVVVTDRFAADAEAKIVEPGKIPAEWMALDIGPATVRVFSEVIKKAQTIVWNGPLGVYEFERFSVGTNQIAQVVSEVRAKTVIGGGDVVAAVEKAGLAEKIYHISTGGGASLEFLEGKELPGVAALEDKEGGDRYAYPGYRGQLENAQEYQGGDKLLR